MQFDVGIDYIGRTRDFAIFVILLWFNIMHHNPAWFSTFNQTTIGPYSSLFWCLLIMGWPRDHT